MKDEGADARRNPVRTEPESVLSGRTLERVAEEEGDGGGESQGGQIRGMRSEEIAQKRRTSGVPTRRKSVKRYCPGPCTSVFVW